jgi:hypothetical protein
MKYRSNLNRDRQRWTETYRGRRLLKKYYSKFWSRPMASNPSTMTMSSERIMNSRSNMVCFK